MYIEPKLLLAPCPDNYCKNGGTCKGETGKFECDCPPGWFGTHCGKLTNSISS